MDDQDDPETIIAKLKAANEQYVKELDEIKKQQEELSSAFTICVTTKEDEIMTLRRRYAEETASYQRLMQEAVTAALENCNQEWQEKELQLQSKCEMLKAEAQELKEQLNERNSQNSVINVKKNLEEDMKKAQENTELLKSVVIPMEREIAHLKMQLSNALKSKNESENVPSQNDQPSACEDEIKKNVNSEGTFQSDVIAATFLEKERLQLEVERERKLREELEAKLSDKSLVSLRESGTSLISLRDLEETLSELQACFERLSIASEARIRDLVRRCQWLEGRVNLSQKQRHSMQHLNVNDDATSSQDEPLTPQLVMQLRNELKNVKIAAAEQINMLTSELEYSRSRLRAETSNNRRYLKRMQELEEQNVMLQSIESEYERLYSRNEETESRIAELHQQLNMCKDVGTKLASSLRLDIEKLMQTS